MSENIERVVKRVEKNNAQGKYEASIELLKPLVENQPENIQLINLIGASCDLAGKTHMAVGYFHKSAEHYFQKKFYDKALAVYKKIIKVQPNDAPAYEYSAKIYELSGNFNEASNFYKSAAQKYLADGNNQKAISLFKEAVKLNPFDQKLKLELIELYKKLGDIPKSIELYLEFVDHFMARGDSAGARTILENILKLDPNNIKALTLLADVSAKLGDKEQTLAAHQKILSFNPDNAEALFSFALEYYERFKDTENTVNMIKKAHRLQPENMDILFKLRELCPNDLEVRQALKVYYLDHGDRKNAVKEILEIANIFENSKNKSMADKLRQKANQMLKEIEYDESSSAPSARSKEKVVSLDALTNSRLTTREQEEGDATNPYFAGLLGKQDNTAVSSEYESAPEPHLQQMYVKTVEESATQKTQPPVPEVQESPVLQQFKHKDKPETTGAINPLPPFGQNDIKTVKYSKPKADIQKPPAVSAQIPVLESVKPMPEESIKPGMAVSTGVPAKPIESEPQSALFQTGSTTSTDELDSVIIEDVDIDPNSLTIKVSTATFKTSDIKERITQTEASLAKEEEKKRVEKAAATQPADKHEEEHKDLTDLLQKLPSEDSSSKVSVSRKMEELKPEITKEILATPPAPQAKSGAIPPPNFLKDRMDVKVVQLSKNDPLQSSSDTLSVKDDASEIYLQLTDIDEIYKPAAKAPAPQVPKEPSIAEVSKRDLKILQEQKPHVREQNGFDLQKIISNPEIAGGQRPIPGPGKRLFSDDTMNLSKQMTDIFNSMISDTSTEPLEDDETRFNLAMSYMEMGLYDDAITEFRSVIGKKEFAMKSARCLAMAYSHKQDNNEAVKWYSKAAELLPEGSEGQLESLYSAGDLCLSMNDYANGQKYLMEIYRRNPSYRDVTAKLEEINSRNRKREQA